MAKLEEQLAARPESVPAEPVLQDPGATTRAAFGALLDAAKPRSFFKVELNGFRLWLPTETLRTMVHCIHRGEAGVLSVLVETQHLLWMMDRLEPGGTFIDVGAATGATTLPIAARFGNAVRIIAYEPATETRELLLATLAENAIGHADIRGRAVADAPGEAEFREFLPDPTGQTPWMPETSSLVGGRLSDSPSRTYRVPIVALDQDIPDAGGSPVVIKIDVEGYERLVLEGAAALIDRHRPHLSIDIHVDPFGDGVESTEPAVRQFLEARGYSCTRQLHVLLCSPG